MDNTSVGQIYIYINICVYIYNLIQVHICTDKLRHKECSFMLISWLIREPEVGRLTPTVSKDLTIKD